MALSQIIMIVIFGGGAAAGLAMIISYRLKEKRCTEQMVCPLVHVEKRVTHTNGRRSVAAYGTIEFNAYGKNIRGEIQVPESAVAGNTVTIFINPHNPEEFVYKDGYWSDKLIYGIVFLVAGMIVIFLELKKG